MEALLTLLFFGVAFWIIFKAFTLIIQDYRKLSTKKRNHSDHTNKSSNNSLVNFYSTQKVWKEIKSAGLYVSSSIELNSAEEVAVITSVTTCRVFRRTQNAQPPKYTLKTLSLLEVIKYFNTRFDGYHVLPEMKPRMA